MMKAQLHNVKAKMQKSQLKSKIRLYETKSTDFP